ncbi:exosortase-dependent surface protein XDP2 [Anabaena sp. UHCC 0451]|uniref:exosortase-dependent surface protein XDP2 n=1 Tax=Anabaena sp. UHCC 0451 TaxID=2055235 RepID=UPI002B203DED|nr:exosortase-dependent surface protein XDP2 [Anabaena sp. UHCC 0451]MEA5576452.1 exosortase-dependent surface protein XDP2 [Anabaena sp. UHCC 0451]
MKIKSAFIWVSLLCSAVLATIDSAKAASFVSNVSQNTNPKADINLLSIIQNGTTINSFSYVNKADIDTTLQNKKNGPASTDRGDNATSPFAPAELPSNEAIAKFLGNNNLNNIIDTEDDGSFVIDVFFDNEIVQDNSGLDNLFFWERGMNSDLGIQALDIAGNVIGKFKKITEIRNSNNYAGFQIDTKEIGGSQKVGSWGVSLQELEVEKLSGLRLTSQADYKGPDFKVIARNGGNKTEIPEPTTILGLGAVAGMAFLSRRQKMLKNS